MSKEEVIKKIYEKEVTGENLVADYEDFYDRISTKVILLNREDKIANIHFLHSDLYMVPGGKQELGETPEKAVKREAKEETGYEIKLIDKLGIIVDYKEKIKQKNLIHCFLGKVVGSQGERNFTENELKDGAPELVWLTPEESLKVRELEVKATPEEVYISKFIQATEKELLKYYLEKR